MLPKENRLKKVRDFERVFKQGKGFKQGFLFFKILENDSDNKRFGFVVSQKVSKKAVERNKVKRRLREIVKKRLLKIKKGMDCVLVALPGIEKKEFDQVQKDIDKLFEKAGIIKNARGKR